MDKLIEIFAEVLNTDPAKLNDDTSPDNNSNWDSLSAMALIPAIEDVFSVELTTAEIMSMRTIGFVRSILCKKGVEGI